MQYGTENEVKASDILRAVAAVQHLPSPEP